FIQAEDGIRDPLVTGVQTCALPIFMSGAWEQDKQGRVAVSLPLRIALTPLSGKFPNIIDATATVQSKAAIDPLRYAGLDDFAMPEWELKHLQLLRSHQMKK